MEMEPITKRKIVFPTKSITCEEHVYKLLEKQKLINQGLNRSIEEGHQANRTELKSNVDAASETIYSALDALQEKGLVEEKAIGIIPRTIITCLTEKGVAFADKFTRQNSSWKARTRFLFFTDRSIEVSHLRVREAEWR